MTTYRHTESEVEIITESELSGDWELVEETTKTTKKTKSEEEKSEE
ncbi:hypothetical protein [Gemella morbillorum]